ncbi:hypothetical protein PsAD5_02337 [Pseudovibrio sp. Ad5]|uniref:hypothetical protein n=1 Tax=Pseudovibrio sp. Ad5 TaxID=989436 RepID=UPI0007B23F86|nr:hypothetical protein [Pseudovibrio sp. Ad5]KZK97248.1 hypothetical protein PsAD5_02337 [Pseudovibrio sp. Ad5]
MKDLTTKENQGEGTGLICSDELKASQTQIGGDHYKYRPIQPFQFSMKNNLDPLQHTVVKYVTRFREKTASKIWRRQSTALTFSSSMRLLEKSTRTVCNPSKMFLLGRGYLAALYFVASLPDFLKSIFIDLTANVLPTMPFYEAFVMAPNTLQILRRLCKGASHGKPYVELRGALRWALIRQYQTSYH